MTNPLNSWQAPIPLGVLKIPMFSDSIFPEKIQTFINELSVATETPIELASMAVLSILSTAVQGKYKVEVKPDYQEPLNIWACVALPPGSRKSAVLSAITVPLIEWEKKKRLELEPEINKIISENKSLEARIKELRRQASSSKENYHSFNEEIVMLESKILEVPVFPQLYTTDITPENLGTMMASNKERMAVLSDEAGIFDILEGRYSGGIPNLDIFLQGHAGSSVRVNRGSRPPVFLERPFLTLGLTPQPDVLRGLTKNPAFRGRGLLGRFLYAIPVSNLGSRNLSAKNMSKEVKEGFYEVISLILNQQEVKVPLILKLSEEAYKDWRSYALVIEVKMADDGPFVHIRDWSSKLAGAIARIAGLIHVARHAQYDPQVIEISKEDMKESIKLGHVLSEHALAAFDLMGADPALDGARAILDWVKRNRKEQFTFRDCHYAHKNRFKRAKDMEPSVEILEDRCFIKEIEKEKKAHRPSRFFEVNPQVYDLEA